MKDGYNWSQIGPGPSDKRARRRAKWRWIDEIRKNAGDDWTKIAKKRTS